MVKCFIILLPFGGSIPPLPTSALTIKTAKIMNEFDYKGHHYKVVNVENSTDCIIIKDGRQTRRVSKAIADHAMENVDKLFK